MKGTPWVTFDIDPIATPRKPKHGTTLLYENYLRYQKDLRTFAKAKRFNLSDNFKIVFILPVSKKLEVYQQAELIGKPHLTGKKQLARLIKGVTTALRGEEDDPDADVYRIDASKYWGEKGKIILRNIIAPDFDYLRQIK